MTVDVVTIGNATIDAFLILADSNSSVSLDNVHKRLCVDYGQKIPLESCDFLPGGNACNVAVGLSRAGFKTAILAEIATDEFSEKILNGLKKEDVGTDFLLRGEGQSSFSIALNFQGERTLFVEHHDRAHNFNINNLEAKALYLTSLGHTWQQVYRNVAAYLQARPEVVLAFNPGSTQLRDGVKTFDFIFPLTTILFVNREEAEKIVGSKDDIPALLTALQSKGCKLISLTDGERGGYAIDEHGKVYHQPKITCPVVERTGAGDAYASGFLAAFLNAQPISTCMLWGAHNAASVIGQIGAQPGLLRKEELAIKQ